RESGVRVGILLGYGARKKVRRRVEPLAIAARRAAARRDAEGAPVGQRSRNAPLGDAQADAVHDAGAPSCTTLKVFSSVGFGVSVAVPLQYESPPPSARFVP